MTSHPLNYPDERAILRDRIAVIFKSSPVDWTEEDAIYLLLNRERPVVTYQRFIEALHSLRDDFSGILAEFRLHLLSSQTEWRLTLLGHRSFSSAASQMPPPQNSPVPGDAGFPQETQS